MEEIVYLKGTRYVMVITHSRFLLEMKTTTYDMFKINAEKDEEYCFRDDNDFTNGVEEVIKDFIWSKKGVVISKQEFEDMLYHKVI